MKKVKNRALAALIIAALVVAGVGVYIVKFAVSGDKWAAFASNQTVYKSGVLSVGTLVDREGTVLSTVSDGGRVFADNADVRRATLHVVGDATGNIGTGALTAFAPKLIGYDIINGAYSRKGTGKQLKLTIDAELNLVAYNALAGRHGAVAVFNYETGEIFCMVSAPTYDPQNPPEISDDDPAYEGVYLNRAISAVYTPGSTYKLLTAAAAIEEIDDIFDRRFECEGNVKFADGTITCPKAHGGLTFEDALAVSCNCAFAQISLELGAKTLSSYAAKYGLTERTAIDGLKTARGRFDEAEPDSADLAWSGIGQYNDTVCPAAMLRFMGAIANGGVAVDMEIIGRRGLAALGSPGSTRIMKKETAEKLGNMMNYNVHHTYGTDSFPGLDICAKSGTAEVGGGKEPHSWFVGYLDNAVHPLAFVVIVENGGSGTAVAGVVANKVLQAAVS